MLYASHLTGAASLPPVTAAAALRAVWAGDEAGFQAVWPTFWRSWQRCAVLPTISAYGHPEAEALYATARLLPSLARVSPVMACELVRTLGVGSETELLELFGHLTAQTVLIAMAWHNGPRWYHGTTEAAARSILANGFEIKPRNARWGQGGPVPRYGPALFLGGPEFAACYGEWIVVADVTVPVTPWGSPLWCAGARAAGLVCADDETMRAAAADVRHRLRASLLGVGVRAAVYDNLFFRELMVYDPAVLRPVAALPVRELFARRAEFGAAFPLARPKWRERFNLLQML